VIIPVCADVSPGSTFFITIDPVGDHYSGDVVLIQGSTNLPVTEKLRVRVYSSSQHTGRYKIFYGISEAVPIVPGKNASENRWAVEVPTLNWSRDEYLVTAFPDTDNDTHTRGYAGEVFTIFGANERPPKKAAPVSPDVIYPSWTGSLGEANGIADISDISGNGTYWVAGSDSGLLRLYTLQRGILWTFERPGNSVTGVSMSGDGEYTVAVFSVQHGESGAPGGVIRYFNRSGNVQWEHPTDSTVIRVAVSGNGRRVFASDGSTFLSFDRDGTISGKFDTSGTIWSVAASEDGTTGVAGYGNPGNRTGGSGITAMDANGTVLWNFPTRELVRSVDVTSNGSSIVGADFYRFYWFDREGTLLWHYDSSPPFTQVAISPDGEYCAAASQYYLRFFNRTGSLLWTYEDPGYVYGVAVPEARDFVIAVTEDKTLVFDWSGHILRKSDTGAYHVSSSSDGRYFITSGKGGMSYFLLFGGDSTPPPRFTPHPSESPMSGESAKPQSVVPSATQPAPSSPILPIVAVIGCIALIVAIHNFRRE
jgi:WD40 repeat protein